MALIVRSKRRNSFRSASLSVVVLFLCSSSAYSQSLTPQSVSLSAAGQSKIQVKTQLVMLPVSVMDANGNFISG